MARFGDLYAEGRERIIGLVSDDGVDPAMPVPACPRWSVKDVLAHVAGIPADILAGRVDGVATDPWTQAQVDARQHKSVSAIVDEWRETGPQVDAIIDSFGPSGAQLLTDLTTHEHDIRSAVARPGARDADVMSVALDFTLANFLSASLTASGVGPVEVHAGEQTWIIGGRNDDDDQPPPTLTAAPFELLRATTGRRSRAQIAAMAWSTDPQPFLDSFQGGPFTFPPADVTE